MHLISFDASPRQVSKLRNGHKVRIKRGSGFNLVVSPSTYHIVNRAFGKNKGVEVKLTPEEIEHNLELSPEQQEALGEATGELHTPNAEGGSIFKKVKKAFNSKTAKKIGRELRPLSRALKSTARDIAHEKIAEAHMAGAEKYGDDPRMAELMNLSAQMAHEKASGPLRGSGGAWGMPPSGNLPPRGRGMTWMAPDGTPMRPPSSGGKLFGKIKKAFNSKTAKKIGRDLRPLSRALKQTGREIAHEKIAEAHMAGAERYGDDPRMAELMNLSAQMAHERANAPLRGQGLGAGMYGQSINAHEALRLANLATANANHQIAKMHNASVHGQLTQPPIKRYWDDEFSPPSRGTGVRGHLNMIRGRGSMLSADDILPPALQSQPFGANWHMQFFLPPQYHKYNDGTDVEGRGLYI